MVLQWKKCSLGIPLPIRLYNVDDDTSKIQIYARKLLPTVIWSNQTRTFHIKYFLEDNTYKRDIRPDH